jgi:hypothetical protein
MTGRILGQSTTEAYSPINNGVTASLRRKRRAMAESHIIQLSTGSLNEILKYKIEGEGVFSWYGGVKL